MMDPQSVAQRVRDEAVPLLKQRKLILVDLISRVESGRLVIRLLVDKPEGITLDELSGLNKAIGSRLEETELIPERYLLEVNSPGLDRCLKTEADFQSVIGKRVRIILGAPADAAAGRKPGSEQVGRVKSAGEDAVTLELDSGESVRIGIDEIARATQEVNCEPR